MDLELIRSSLKVTLDDKRYLHSLGVEEVAHDLAVIYGYDIDKAKIAGILHDCAKNLTAHELLEACKEYQLPVSKTEEKAVHLLHAKVGAALAKKKFGIEDEEILNAITYHTTGRPAMTLLEKIIFTADFIEPNRRPILRLNEIRRVAYMDLDTAVYMITENTLKFLTETAGDEIDTLTVDTYEYYKTLLQLQ